MKKSKIPEIRFKGCEEEWEERKVGELVINIIDNRGRNCPYYCERGVPIIDNILIKNNLYPNLDEASRFIDEKLFNDFIRNYNKKDDVLITLVGNGIGNVALFPNKKSVIMQNTLGLRTVENKIFNYYVLLSKHNDIMKLDRGMAQPSIRKDELFDFKINIPKLKEQDKVSSLLLHIDNLITFHQQKYEKLQNIKKSCLEKMFPKNGSNVPELRFKGFTEPWKEQKLPNFVDFFSGLTYQPDNVQKNGTLVLRSSNVFAGEVVNADNVYVDSSIIDCDNVKKGDIIVVVRNGSRALIGKHAQIKQDMHNTVIGAFMTGIRSECPSFINALLDSPHFDKEIVINMGATINQITGYMFSKMIFYIPESAEQQHIGNFFSHLDNLLTLQQQKLEKLQNIKKSCLEKMFI